MRVFERVCAVITADADGVALSQTPSGAGNLTLNGVAVIAENGSAPAYIGQAVLTPPRAILITAVGNESSRTFTLYGYDRAGTLISEVVTGPNATTAVSTYLYARISRIAISGAAAAAVTVGWSDESCSAWLPLSQSAGPAGFRVVTVGNDTNGVSLTLEATSKNIMRSGGMTGEYPGAGELQVIDDDGSPYVADVESVCLVPYTAIRLRVIGNSIPITLRVNPNYTV